eukprot:4412225-Prorocentrum_lima.AAC.1
MRGCGVTKATFNKELLDAIHAPAKLDDAMNGFEYTNVQVSVSDGMIPHRDANNLGPSWTISLGDCQGGLSVSYTHLRAHETRRHL